MTHLSAPKSKRREASLSNEKKSLTLNPAINLDLQVMKAVNCCVIYQIKFVLSNYFFQEKMDLQLDSLYKTVWLLL